MLFSKGGFIGDVKTFLIFSNSQLPIRQLQSHFCKVSNGIASTNDSLCTLEKPPSSSYGDKVALSEIGIYVRYWE